MDCVNCGGGTSVSDTVLYEGIRYRRRKCKECNFIMYTAETLVPYELDESMREAFHRKSYCMYDYRRNKKNDNN